VRSRHEQLAQLGLHRLVVYLLKLERFSHLDGEGEVLANVGRSETLILDTARGIGLKSCAELA
jgi:hypothetical protein